jgi:hydrogenase expression/formation protein HypC
MSTMCLGIPGRIIEVHEEAGLRMGRVDFGGVVREVCLACVPEADIGAYVVVHVGFAISVLDEEEARRTLEVLRAMKGVMDAELGAPPHSDRSGP